MTSKEVKLEVESLFAKYYPLFKDTDELRDTITKAVNIVMFELNIPRGMAVNHVKHIVWSYRNKLEDSKDD